MRTNYNFDVFLYFGVVFDRSTVHELALMNGFSTIYDFIESQDLSYQVIGDVNYSDKMIVGKQIHWDYGSHITEISRALKLTSTIYSEEQEHQYANILQFDCEDIEEKFLKLGVNETPKHYIISNYGKI